MANLTNKELMAIEDQLNSEQLLIKKYKAYATMCSDPQIRTKFENYASEHQNHYNIVLNQLS